MAAGSTLPGRHAMHFLRPEALSLRARPPTLQVLAHKDLLQQRLCTLQLAHTEVELAARTALDDVTLLQHAPDQDPKAGAGILAAAATTTPLGGHGDAALAALAAANAAAAAAVPPGGASRVGSSSTSGAGGGAAALLRVSDAGLSVGSGGSSAGGADDGGSAMVAVALARMQLERVRKLAGDALSAVMADKRASGGSTGAATLAPARSGSLPVAPAAPAPAPPPAPTAASRV